MKLRNPRSQRLISSQRVVRRLKYSRTGQKTLDLGAPGQDVYGLLDCTSLYMKT